MEAKNNREFLDYFEKVRQRTLRVIACIPEDKFDWTYSEGKFSFADIIRHMAAIERYMYAENVQRKPSRYPGHGRELAGGRQQVLDFFNRAHLESMEIFGRLTEADLDQKCVTPGGTPITVWKWLRAMVEHEIHHRAQIYTYLGMLGVKTPPIYGLTSEEVRERSQAAAGDRA
ncbi:MAG TPA: DinB family protein [Candidatus Limnocylindrales bacterium]|nr:DinB family protein [Candidatus Limnocylindrales bacterium]